MKKIKFFKRIDKYSPFNDLAFYAEMDRRVADMESGRTPTYTWEEVQARVDKLLQETREKREERCQ